MFNHKLLATGGMYPGLVTTRAIANLGTFDVEVIITPVVTSGGGGGYVPIARGQKPDRYKVTVRVRHNGKLYEDSVIVDDIEARVQAKLNGIEVFTPDEVMISVNNVQQFNEDVVVSATLNTIN